MKRFVSAAVAVGAVVFALSVPPAAPAAPGCDKQLVMQIDSAKISPASGGFAIFAFGTSESAGWKNPTLVSAGAPEDGVATVDFVGCRPEVSAQVLTPIQTQMTVALSASTRQVVIRARTNKMTIDITH